MKLASYDFKDPGLLIEEVAARYELTPGAALLVVVEDPPTHQRITHIEPLDIDSRVGQDVDLSDLLCDLMQELPVPQEERPIKHSVMTVLVRPGAAIFGPHESRWMLGWRYSHHFTSAFTGGVILVTEHGWVDFMTDWGGHQPAMVAS